MLRQINLKTFIVRYNVTESFLRFSLHNAELRMKISDGGYSYNSTLSHILVEYASAVSSSFNHIC
jgi:hypothetical protein